MTQGPFLLRLCRSGAFTGFQSIPFFAVNLCWSGKPSVTACPMNGTSRHQRRQTGKNAVYVGPNEFESAYTAYFFTGVCPVSRSRHGLLSFSVFPFFNGFLLGIFSKYASTAVYLHFCAFQLVRIRWSFSFWAQR